jgi:hypothetical protein
MTVMDRARAYVARMDAAVSGGGGHDATFRVACVLVEGFSLGYGDAMEVMREYNNRCDPPWSDRELEHKVRSAEGKIGNPGYLLRGTSLQDEARRGPVRGSGAANEPRARAPQKRPDFDAGKLREFVKGADEVGEDFFRARSAVEVPPDGEQGWDTSRLFLETVYRLGDRVLIFRNEMSQGQWLYEVGRGLFELGKEPGERARRAEEAPRPGPAGMWYLAQPVDGLWRKGAERMTRRSGACVQRWDWLVLESDDADEGDWRKLLAKLPMPIAAIYTSGGRSYHALVKVGAESKAQWDAMRDEIFYRLLCPLGGDGGAMSAVRLSRLPGMRRKGKRTWEGKMEWYPQARLQRLIYLDPRPDWVAIRTKGVRRG